jgi:hypothetical protein
MPFELKTNDPGPFGTSVDVFIDTGVLHIHRVAIQGTARGRGGG